MKGFLILGGKGVNLEEVKDDKFCRNQLFFCTNSSDAAAWDIMYKIVDRVNLIGASFWSATFKFKNRDYVLLNGGYKKRDDESKLNREYNSILDFNVINYLEDISGLKLVNHLHYDEDDNENDPEK